MNKNILFVNILIKIEFFTHILNRVQLNMDLSLDNLHSYIFDIDKPNVNYIFNIVTCTRINLVDTHDIFTRNGAVWKLFILISYVIYFIILKKYINCDFYFTP